MSEVRKTSTQLDRKTQQGAVFISCHEWHINTHHLNVTQVLSVADVPGFLSAVAVWDWPPLNIKHHNECPSYACVLLAEQHVKCRGVRIWFDTHNRIPTQAWNVAQWILDSWHCAASLLLTSRGSNTLRLHYKPPDQTPPVFPASSDIITYSGPIPALSWDSLLYCFVKLQMVAPLCGG